MHATSERVVWLVVGAATALEKEKRWWSVEVLTVQCTWKVERVSRQGEEAYVTSSNVEAKWRCLARPRGVD